jgi:peptide/nickel transport system permease protein
MPISTPGFGIANKWPDKEDPKRMQSLWMRFLTKARRIPLIPLSILLMVALSAVFAPQLAPHQPDITNLKITFLPPAFLAGGNVSYFLGTDNLGRDIWSRLIWGARISMLVAATVVISGAGIGTLLGLLAGYFGGWVDSFIMRITDTMLALPWLLIAIVVVSVVGASLTNVILLIVLLQWAGFARLVRGETLSMKERDFVALAKIAGCTRLRILALHILPNVTNTIIVMATLHIGQVILFEAALSFLGVGVPPPTATWGAMVADGRNYISSAWWISLFPGLAITAVCLAGNLFGDWLRDALDPKRRQL